jgi:hypothetical protein
MVMTDGATSAVFILDCKMEPDEFFTAEQQQRLEELLSRWRVARDGGRQFPSEEQAELEALVEAQLEGSARRVEAAFGGRAQQIDNTFGE